MAEKYTYADVIIDPEDPRVEIGKEYYCSCYPSGGLNLANMGIGYQELVRVDKDYNSFCPFVVKKDDGIESFPCLIRKKEPLKKYVPFDLSKKEDRNCLKGKWLKRTDTGDEDLIISFSEDSTFIAPDQYWDADKLLALYVFEDGTPCGRLVVE